MTPLHRLLRRWRGGFYRLCNHRSHRLRLPCFRYHALDGYCGKHVGSCYHTCEKAASTPREIA